MVVTFDFDQTLTKVRWCDDEECFVPDGPHLFWLNVLRTHLHMGDEVHIVTTRDDTSTLRQEIREHLIEHFGSKGATIPIHMTNGKLKRRVLAKLGSDRHFDDDEDEINNLPEGCQGVLIPWPPCPLDLN